MATRLIGETPVSPVGLGGAQFCFTDHPLFSGSNLGPPDEDRGIRTIHAALDSGITFVDTARAYTTNDHPGYSEALIARALASHPAGSKVLVATKGGHFRSGDDFPFDVSRDTIRRHCETSIQLLGVDRIDLYQLHHLPAEESMQQVMKTFGDLRDEGLVRDVGVCNVSQAQLDEALSVVPVASVQNQFSPFRLDDRELVDSCAEQSIAFLAYSPLGGGRAAEQLFGTAATKLGDAFPAAAAVAQRKNVSVQRLALAWLLSLSPTLVLICGASRPESIRDSAAAADLVLTEDELGELDFGRANGGSAA